MQFYILQKQIIEKYYSVKLTSNDLRNNEILYKFSVNIFFQYF